jgi:hypothetical protein
MMQSQPHCEFHRPAHLPERALTSSGKDGSGERIFTSGGKGALSDKVVARQPPTMRTPKTMNRLLFFILVFDLWCGWAQKIAQVPRMCIEKCQDHILMS